MELLQDKLDEETIYLNKIEQSGKILYLKFGQISAELRVEDGYVYMRDGQKIKLNDKDIIALKQEQSEWFITVFKSMNDSIANTVHNLYQAGWYPLVYMGGKFYQASLSPETAQKRKSKPDEEIYTLKNNEIEVYQENSSRSKRRETNQDHERQDHEQEERQTIFQNNKDLNKIINKKPQENKFKNQQSNSTDKSLEEQLHDTTKSNFQTNLLIGAYNTLKKVGYDINQEQFLDIVRNKYQEGKDFVLFYREVLKEIYELNKSKTGLETKTTQDQSSIQTQSSEESDLENQDWIDLPSLKPGESTTLKIDDTDVKLKYELENGMERLEVTIGENFMSYIYLPPSVEIKSLEPKMMSKLRIVEPTFFMVVGRDNKIEVISSIDELSKIDELVKNNKIFMLRFGRDDNLNLVISLYKYSSAKNL